jgi:hypothetical protein
MLKNKKNISIIAIVLIAIIGLVYVGCSKTTDMQTTPNNNNIKLLNSENVGLNPDFCGNYTFRILEVSEFPEEELENLVVLNPGIEDFAITIANGINEDYIQFDSDNHKKAFLNKVYALINMLEVKNYNGALKKIENDINEKIFKWIPEDEYLTGVKVYQYFEIIKFYINNPDLELIGVDPIMFNFCQISGMDPISWFIGALVVKLSYDYIIEPYLKQLCITVYCPTCTECYIAAWRTFYNSFRTPEDVGTRDNEIKKCDATTACKKCMECQIQ